MLRRKDVGELMVIGWFATVGVVGCATSPKREAPPAEASSRSVRRGAAADVIQPVQFTPAQPTTTTPNPNDADPLSRLLRDAEQSCAQNDSYICRLRRREHQPGKPKPEEVLIFKCRARPFSVHFKWLGEEGKGREVVFVGGRGDDKLHILTAAGDIPLTPAGRRLDLPADSLLVRSASKYPITEAGLCRTVARFHRLLDDSRRGVPGLACKYLGPMSRPEFAGPLEMVEITLPPNREPEAPRGGRRLLGFDSLTKWPVFSTTFDPEGREIDYYCFDRFQLNVRLDDDDFNADKMWPVRSAGRDPASDRPQ